MLSRHLKPRIRLDSTAADHTPCAVSYSGVWQKLVLGAAAESTLSWDRTSAASLLRASRTFPYVMSIQIASIVGRSSLMPSFRPSFAMGASLFPTQASVAEEGGSTEVLDVWLAARRLSDPIPNHPRIGEPEAYRRGALVRGAPSLTKALSWAGFILHQFIQAFRRGNAQGTSQHNS